MSLRVAAVAVVMVLAAAAPARAAIDLAIDDCLEATPHAYALPTGPPLELRVLVLLDGVAQAAAVQVMSDAAGSYAPLGIDLRVGAYKPVSFAPVDPSALIELSRNAVGGARPPWTHLVYTLTSKDLDTGGATGRAVAGQADCIGGVAFDASAFAVGEVEAVGAEYAPLVAGHELGHLMGAHHHYANCAEGLLVAVFPPCTLMINDIGLAASNFSTLNSAIVRGHAERWAKPLPPVPTPAPAPSSAPAPTTTPAASPDPDPATPPPSDGTPPPDPAARPAATQPDARRVTAACAAAREALTRAVRAERASRGARSRIARRRLTQQRARVRQVRQRARRACR